MSDSTSPRPWMTAWIGAPIVLGHLGHARGMPSGTRERPGTAQTIPTTTGVVKSII